LSRFAAVISSGDIYDFFGFFNHAYNYCWANLFVGELSAIYSFILQVGDEKG
jgi:hypothetical protein